MAPLTFLDELNSFASRQRLILVDILSDDLPIRMTSIKSSCAYTFVHSLNSIMFYTRCSMPFGRRCQARIAGNIAYYLYQGGNLHCLQRLLPTRGRQPISLFCNCRLSSKTDIILIAHPNGLRYTVLSPSDQISGRFNKRADDYR